MTNILLVCSAGMSTSLMVKKMEAAAKEQGIEIEIKAVPDAQAANNLEGVDVMLLGPQIRFLLSKMQELAGDTPVDVIDMRHYAMMDGASVLKQALSLVK